MRQVLLLLSMIASAVGQDVVPSRISPDDAAKHSLTGNSADYPAIVQTTNIQGNVILEVGINENGIASVRRLVTGHPLLAPAAITAVNRWKYQPFEVGSTAVPVVTFVMVTFGNPSNHTAEDRAELMLQDAFWSAIESAQAALGKHDYASTEEQMNKAKSLVPPESADLKHVPERWQWMTTMGRLRMAQQKYDEAEQYYRKALALRENKAFDKDAPELAASLANLGNLFVEEKKPDLAHEQFSRSVAIYQKNFKSVGKSNPGARQAYGRAIAYQSWLLFNLAKQRNDAGDGSAQCHTLVDFQEFLRTTDRESFLSACQQKTSAASQP